jgi:hypothetical protein
MPGVSRKLRVFALALFLIVLGARLSAVAYAGSDLPTWDQWFAEFGNVLSPLTTGELTGLRLSAPHNEHRVLFPKLMTVMVIGLTGRWEPMDELVLSAFIRAMCGAVVFLWLARGQTGFARGALFALLAGIWSFPVGVFNLTSGFQMQFFVGEALAVGALAALCAGTLTVERLCLGMGLLLVSSLNMASTAITAFAAGGALFLRGLRAGDRARSWAAACCVSILGFVIFWTSPRLEGLGARRLEDAWRIFTQLASWPLAESSLLAVASLLPPALLLRRLMTRPARDWSWFVFALSLLGLVQNAAIAFARAYVTGQIGFAQYEDNLWFANVVGLLAVFEAFRLDDGSLSPLSRRICGIWALALGTIVVADAWTRGVPTLAGLRESAASREPVLARALATGDFARIGEESRAVTAMLDHGDYRFFVSPAGRFVVPARYLEELAGNRARFQSFMPARLTGAPRSLFSRVLDFLGAIGPLFIIMGIGVVVAAVRLDDRNDPGPVTA